LAVLKTFPLLVLEGHDEEPDQTCNIKRNKGPAIPLRDLVIARERMRDWLDRFES
jgi:hypothetical protein